MKKKMLSRLLSLCMALAMVLCIAPSAFAAEFSDVPANAWYREAVDYVSDNGLMAGTGSGQFSPNSTMSRAMLVTVLHRMDGTPAASGNGGFSDVPANAYYTAAVAWASANQIVSGTGNGNFSPNALISRQQLAAILYRYAAYKNYDTSASTDISRYADASAVSGYAQDAMRWAVGAGIISGSDGQLMPSGSATRAQAAAMLMRFAQGRTDRPNVEPQPSESRVLIAYFSRANFVSPGTDAISGATASAANTKTVAEHIQRTVGGDLFEIVPARDYPESHSEASAIAGQELEDDARPELTTHVPNMDSYDTIILGYPAWHHTAPMAVRTFLEEYDFTGKTIVPYMTSLGNSVDQSVSDIRTLCPSATVLDGIALTHGSSNRWNEQAAQWLNGLDIFSAASPSVPPPANQERTEITLTIGNQRLNAWLNGSTASKELISRLPVTVTLADSDNDYCGSISPALPYEQSEVQSGYRNGNLAFWTAGNDFVIFVDDEESSANTGNLVILGQVTDDYSFLIGRGGTVDVTIALKGQEAPIAPAEPTPANPTGEQRMKITVGNQVIYATLADNATAHAIADRLPLTLELLDLYGREMCYRFADEMPANEGQTRNFELGEIIYWPPRHSFVIMYKQDGEQFSMQHVGQLENVNDVALFGQGNVTVTFELAD